MDRRTKEESTSVPQRLFKACTTTIAFASDPEYRGIRSAGEKVAMPHVVTDLCFDCKHTDCVAVCPVDCFHEDDRSLWIDPVECIDCAACVPECPEEAIFDVVSLPEKYHDCILKNAERSKALPIIIETAEPLLAKSSCS